MEEDKTQVDMSSYINDIRDPIDFRSISFSKYKKTEVRNAFIENMLKGKIEPACNWCAELICAGHYMDVWEIILHYIGKHIHLGNPKLVIYLEMRYNMFKEIMNQSNYINDLQVRNNEKIRKLFAEIVCILSLSARKHSFEPIKINREEEFDMTQMTDRLKAPNVQYAEPVFFKEDPKELYIAINEFAYNISSDKPNIMQACYWIEWIIEFDLICKKRKQICKCFRRKEIHVENKYQKDIIWIVWSAVLHYGKNRGPYIEKLLNALLNLFCIKYTTASSKKRRYLLYFCVGLIVEPVPTNIDLITNKEILNTVISQINQVYKQIKKNEKSPGTDYLFANLNKENNYEKSLKKLEMMDAIGFIPRNEHMVDP